MKNFKATMFRGVIKENATFVLFLGLCPTLAMTSNVTNALGMGISVIFVLVLSNAAVAAVRKFVPDNIRIPFYITIIATVVTILQIALSVISADIYESLGIYLPLIVVNCIVLGRAEAFASKNTVVDSMLDGFAVGCGFLLSLTILGTFRELLGTGGISLFGITMFSTDQAMNILVQPAGAFLLFGILAWIVNTVKANRQKEEA